MHAGGIEITYPKVKPVYINSGGTLDLICELDEPFNLMWERSLFQDVSGDDRRRQQRDYDTIDTSSVSGFYMISRDSWVDGRGWTRLIKYNVSVNDAGSYRCRRTGDARMAYAVDINVLKGQSHTHTHTHAASLCQFSSVQLSSPRLTWC